MNYFTNTPHDRVVSILGEKALSRYSSLFEAIREKYFAAENPPVATLIEGWQELNTGYCKPSQDLRNILEDDIDLGLLYLLQKEGVVLSDNKISRSAKLIENLQTAGLSGMNLSPELDDKELMNVLVGLYERVIDKSYVDVYSHDEKASLQRVKELRQTNPQMISLVRLITQFSYRNLIGIGSPELVVEAPMLADLMGMNPAGFVDYKTWSSNESAFNHAAEELFLTPHLKTDKKFSKANEGMHYSNVTNIGLSLSGLPAQSLVLRGHDPVEIMKVLRRKLTFLYTYKHGDNAYTRDMVECHAKMAFLPFPRLWPILHITAEDFLGCRLGNTPHYSLPLDSNDNHAWVGISRKSPMQRIFTDLEKEGIHLDDPKYKDRRGYALGYFVNVFNLPSGAIDEMIEDCKGDTNQIPNVFKHHRDPALLGKAEKTGALALSENQLFLDCLSLCAESSQISLLAKLLHENKTDRVATCNEMYLSDKKYYMRFIGKNHPQLFSKVLDSILSTKRPKPKIVEQMLTFGAPSAGHLNKLSEYQAGKLLEVGLGL